MLTDRQAKVVIGLVCVVWAVNFGARFVVPGYQPQESINAIFMAIVGGAFALKGRGGHGGGGNGDDRPGGRHGRR